MNKYQPYVESLKDYQSPVDFDQLRHKITQSTHKKPVAFRLELAFASAFVIVLLSLSAFYGFFAFSTEKNDLLMSYIMDQGISNNSQNPVIDYVLDE